MKHQIVMNYEEVRETIARRFGVEKDDVMLVDKTAYIDLWPFYINGEIVEEKKGE